MSYLKQTLHRIITRDFDLYKHLLWRPTEYMYDCFMTWNSLQMMKVSFQKYIDKLKTNLSFQKSKVCFVLSYKWLIICMMKTSKQSGDNTQSVHPELKSRWGFFFLTELIICSHSFYVPNIYQSTVYLSLYLSKLKFTVNLTFQGVLFHPTSTLFMIFVCFF